MPSDRWPSSGRVLPRKWLRSPGAGAHRVYEGFQVLTPDSRAFELLYDEVHDAWSIREL
jgi:hypothetical protein